MRALLVSLILLLGLTGAFAVPTETYATAADGSALTWDVYQPTVIGGPWPAAIVIHEGGYQSGDTNGTSLKQCATDLANAGYIAFAIRYRLAPPGSISGQSSTGYAPQQYADVHLAVAAARADSRSNGFVFAVGGSAGGGHAIWVACTGTAGGDRADAAVTMSASVDFTDYTGQNVLDIRAAMTNYCNVPNQAFASQSPTDQATLVAQSPDTQVTATASPMWLGNGTIEPMPLKQWQLITAKCVSVGLTNYFAVSYGNANHGFDNWATCKSSAFAFMQAVVAGPRQRNLAAHTIARRR